MREFVRVRGGEVWTFWGSKRVVEGAGVIYAVKPTYSSGRVVHGVVSTNVGITEVGVSRNICSQLRIAVGGLGRTVTRDNRGITVLLSAGNPRIEINAFGSNSIRLIRNTRFDLFGGGRRNSRANMDLSFPGLISVFRSRNRGTVNERLLLSSNVVSLIIGSMGPRSVIYAMGGNNILGGHGDVGVPNCFVGVPCMDTRSEGSVRFNLGRNTAIITTSFIHGRSSIEALHSFVSDLNCRCIRVVTGVRGRDNISSVSTVVSCTSNVVITHKSVNIRVPFVGLPRVRGAVVEGIISENGCMVATARVLRDVAATPHPAETRVDSITGTICSNADTMVLSTRSTTNGCPVRDMGTLSTVYSRTRRGNRFATLRRCIRRRKVGSAGPVESDVYGTTGGVTRTMNTGTVVIRDTANQITETVIRCEPSYPIVTITASRLIYEGLYLG